MSKLPAVDREKLRQAIHKLRRAELSALLNDAIDEIPPARWPVLLGNHLDFTKLGASGPAKQGLLPTVQAFYEASRAGEYYESFEVNSKNSNQKSEGTEHWIAECNRLCERCAEASPSSRPEEIRQAFELIFELLRLIDHGKEQIVFFADEPGSWQVMIEWERVIPAWLECLARSTGPEEFGAQVVGVLKDFVQFDRNKYLPHARSVSRTKEHTLALDAAVKAAGW